jgi:hypothetical protein
MVKGRTEQAYGHPRGRAFIAGVSDFAHGFGGLSMADYLRLPAVKATSGSRRRPPVRDRSGRQD